MWDYHDVIQELSSVYCMSQLNERGKETKDYCLCVSHEDLSSPSLQYQEIDFHQKLSDMEDFKQKFCLSTSQCQAMPEIRYEMKDEKSTSTKSKNLSQKLDIKQKLISLRWRILNQYVSVFVSSKKKAKSVTKKNLKRRSKYIGVSKNNANWQALINVNQIKKYIGTFTDELQAARAYDLYSVAMKGEEASLNFDYTPSDMLERIQYFLEYDYIKYD
ncbi:unnamed protein product [Moneuplotes crassus]|uniref:AP2/ERF domain-containing protein n=1 Tax=Euplotes crassus TaxID=5936 RepID=A0AAD2D6N8_EUPCR|nr:unnamed protein product [Moneuplotes crassus]